jgi:mannitol/fructose-specific phosphotransferase system IIA component (Ntr-type)
MIRVRGTLLPEHVLLDLTARSREEIIRQLSASLRSDTRISDWKGFLGALAEREATGKVNLHFGLTLPHVRTSSVTKMLMAFARLAEPLPQKDGPLQFAVLIGIPRAMDAEYLRIVGILMRVFRNEKLRQKLLLAHKPSEIIQIFEKGETGREDDE